MESSQFGVCEFCPNKLGSIRRRSRITIAYDELAFTKFMGERQLIDVAYVSSKGASFRITILRKIVKGLGLEASV